MRSITARKSIAFPDVASTNFCLIQVEYGTRQVLSSSTTRSRGIQKNGSSVQTSPSSTGGKTNTTAVKSVVQEASTPGQPGLHGLGWRRRVRRGTSSSQDRARSV